jgi:putative tryptophan/tyrosine transport system substrate-binding protein
MPLVGVFMNLAENDQDTVLRLDALKKGISTTGVTFVPCYGGGDYSSYSVKARELLEQKPVALFASCWPTMWALQRETASIPIVYGGMINPEGQPEYNYGENITGYIAFEPDRLCKSWPNLLKQIAPAINRAVVVYDPDSANTCSAAQYNEIEKAAGPLGITLSKIDVREPRPAIESAIANFASQPNGGLIVPALTLSAVRRDWIITAAANNKLVAVYPNGTYTTSGGLLSYGPNLLDLYRRAGTYINRILNNTKPSELPVQIETAFELVIKRGTANALGLPVPTELTLEGKKISAQIIP